jgi:predicted MPP superfamily phosphohydrolase
MAILRFLFETPALACLVALPFLARAGQQAWAQPANDLLARWMAVALLTCGLADWLLLAALPLLGLSFGPVGPPWLGLTLIRAGLVLGAAALAQRYLPNRVTGLAILALAVNLAFLAGEVYALYFEPFNLGVTRLQLTWPGEAHIRIVHLSDWHVERTTRREQDMLETVSALEPDLILLTGDYLNLSNVNDPRARRDARQLLGQLQAPYGVYAIPGTPVVDTDEALEDIFAGLDNVTLLHDAFVRLELDGPPVYVVGVANLAWERDRQALVGLMNQFEPEAYTILLYHKPDLIESAADLGVDLYLAGHTHGGQVRLPGHGAVVTFSRYGKRFESGLHQVGPTRLYVSRGIGMEGWIVPRVRFLCPPEIVAISLTAP